MTRITFTTFGESSYCGIIHGLKKESAEIFKKMVEVEYAKALSADHQTLNAGDINRVYEEFKKQNDRGRTL